MPYEINDNRVDGGLLIEYGTQPCVLCGELISTDNIADFIRYRTEPCRDCAGRDAYLKRKENSDRAIQTHHFRLQHEPGYQAGGKCGDSYP